ncbi:TonB-dependent receptor [Flavicella marina]|uniref:TonB-dependent receptor n=1 Tax=Flavicella marina TaxID=1475951 RepID=UPI0012644C21|nr:TonB-dependent receptor [Flavicella marina]
MKKHLLIISFVLFSVVSFAQTTISGKVVDSNSNEPIPGANITLEGTTIGTSSDFDGNFKLETTQNPPFNIKASSVGFSATTKNITQNNQQITIILKEGTLLDEVVVSASRTPERIFESPVTIERIGIKEIEATSSATYYDGLENLKGVDVNTSSLTFKSVNTRGFAAFSNTRFLQLVDGMDNASPALNFPVGNLLGISELDIQGVELLPGASSALYGANAFNGILFMNSKNPFDHEGVSAYLKSGVTVQDANGTNEFFDVGVRVAKKFSDKFAAKVNISFLEGTDWAATDYKQYDDQGAGKPDLITENPTGPEFDRANIYGDEVSTDIGAGASPLPEGTVVSRTGYKETDLTDYKAKSFKTDVGLFYRPNGDDLEISYNGRFGTGNTVYQGANRYYLKNFIMQQHKLEVRNDHFFWRAYMTAEDAGDSYDMFFTGVNMNKVTAEPWFQRYAQVYGANLGMGSEKAHEIARETADSELTLQPGTPEFDELFNKTISDGDLNTGSKFVDKSKIYHSDINYNFKELIPFAEIQVGGSARRYSLNSSGTIFTDADGPINYDEFGAYAQGQKWLVEETLKLTASVRYDKSQNFDGFFSPRVSLVYNADEDKKHNFRLSYQTGFRNPTTQDQYIGLDLGRAILIGSAADNLDRYQSLDKDVSATGQAFGNPATVNLTGRDAYENSYTLESVGKFSVTQNPADLEIAEIELVKPEQVTAFEFGYRGIVNKLVIDFSTYYNIYKDFIGNKTVVSPFYGKVDFSDGTYPTPGGNIPKAVVALGSGDFQPFQTYTNSSADISSYGAAIGLSTKVMGNFDLGFNYTWAKFDFDQSSDPDYEAGFNTPQHKVKVSFGNTNIGHNFGFRLDARWNDAYLWESTFIDAILPARTTVDAQVTYNMPKLKSQLKVGAANLLGHEYQSAPGAGTIGSQIYASWTVRGF